MSHFNCLNCTFGRPHEPRSWGVPLFAASVVLGALLGLVVLQ